MGKILFFVTCWNVFLRERKSSLLLVCEVKEEMVYLRFKSGKTIQFPTKISEKTIGFRNPVILCVRRVGHSCFISSTTSFELKGKASLKLDPGNLGNARF